MSRPTLWLIWIWSSVRLRNQPHILYLSSFLPKKYNEPTLVVTIILIIQGGTNHSSLKIIVLDQNGKYLHCIAVVIFLGYKKAKPLAISTKTCNIILQAVIRKCHAAWKYTPYSSFNYNSISTTKIMSPSLLFFYI